MSSERIMIIFLWLCVSFLLLKGSGDTRRITTLEHAIDTAIAATVRDIEPMGGE